MKPCAREKVANATAPKWFDWCCWLALALVLAGSTVLADTNTTNPPARWPTLDHVKQKWADVPLAAVTSAAEAGDLTAAHYLGYCFTEGFRFPKDSAAGISWYERAARGGYAPSMANLGNHYEYGQGVAQDHRRALTYFRQAADLGIPTSMVALYVAYWDGTGVAADHAEAMRWLEKAAEAGNANAECLLGYRYENPELTSTHAFPPPNWPAAVDWYRRSADQNWAGGKYHLAGCYLAGNGVEQDEERGLQLMRQAADQNFIYALSDLAGLYAQGIGDPRNAADRPIALLERVVKSDGDDGGYLVRDAYEHIILRYEHGVGTPRDVVAAAQWYCRAALAGCNEYTLIDKLPAVQPRIPTGDLGEGSGYQFLLYARPAAGASRPFRLVLSQYLKAASGNDPAARGQIGLMYLQGRNAPQNASRAALWFSLAAAGGDPAGQASLAAVQKGLTAGEWESVSKLVPEMAQELNSVSNALRVEAQFLDQGATRQNP